MADTKENLLMIAVFVGLAVYAVGLFCLAVLFHTPWETLKDKYGAGGRSAILAFGIISAVVTAGVVIAGCVQGGCIFLP